MYTHDWSLSQLQLFAICKTRTITYQHTDDPGHIDRKATIRTFHHKADLFSGRARLLFLHSLLFAPDLQTSRFLRNSKFWRRPIPVTDDILAFLCSSKIRSIPPPACYTRSTSALSHSPNPRKALLGDHGTVGAAFIIEYWKARPHQIPFSSICTLHCTFTGCRHTYRQANTAVIQSSPASPVQPTLLWHFQIFLRQSRPVHAWISSGPIFLITSLVVGFGLPTSLPFQSSTDIPTHLKSPSKHNRPHAFGSQDDTP